MNIRCGVDVVHIERFTSVLSGGEKSLLNRLFHPEELMTRDAEHLAGIFAAKESVVKAFSLLRESWLSIRIGKHPSGKPFVEFVGKPPKHIISHDLSIAHDGGVAIATYVAILDETP